MKPAMWIDGEWHESGAGGQAEVIDPATGQAFAHVPLAGPLEVDAAAAVAARGFAGWRRRSALERCDVLTRAAALMRERAGEMAVLLTREQGKPTAEALREVRLSADIIAFQAEEARRLYGHSVPPRVEGVLAHHVLHEPVGPVAAFTAWNFPVNLPSRKLGAALAAGCSVVLKPAEQTPHSAVALVKCLLDAGLPGDVVQLVFGDPPMVSTRLIEHPAIAQVSLTGSVAVGRMLAEQCARVGKRFSGELGGHAPVIVAADADVDFAARLSVAAKFRNAGQVCASPIRFIVARSRYDAFLRAFVARAMALRVGPGEDPQTQMGPLATARRVDEMVRLVDDARDHGARVACGARTLQRPGFFFEPTVLTEVSPAALVMREEPFGPIALLEPFDDIDDAIGKANTLPHGQPYALGAFAFTRDLMLAHRLAEEIDAGMVGINHYGVSQPELPFGGRKASGDGVEMGAEGIRAFTTLKTVTFGRSEP